jgi:3-keto-5-aminohexanoate cleavage enzyme
MMGVDSVRVGMEDHIWMYPHKNELIKSNADETRKIATIARELGREIATPGQARQILGIG